MKPHLNLFSFVFFTITTVCFGQSLDSIELKLNPIAKITNYTRSQFNADPQFWTMCEDDQGITIFGNNDGAVFFDGNHWNKINLPNNSSVRSLLKTKSGKIYAGGYNEFGTLQKNEFGQYYYTSLIEELQLTNKHIENVWQIQEINNAIVCRTFNGLIVITGKTALFIPCNQSFLNSAVINNRYFVHDANHGIYSYNIVEKELELVFEAGKFNNEEISAMHYSGKPNSILLFTKSGSIYSGNTLNKEVVKIVSLFNENQNDQITCAIQKNAQTILIGTLNSKVIEFSTNGFLNYHNPSYSGLKNIAIHNLYKSKDNFWVLYNNGLSFVDYNPSYINLFDKASVYDVLIHNSKIYLATNSGVYYADMSINNVPGTYYNFIKLNGIQGQTWSVTLASNDVIIGHDNGLFVLDGLKPIKIGSESGFWKITPIKGKENSYLASNYTGLFLLKKIVDKWEIIHKIKGFDESARDILPSGEKNTYWICHGYQGVFKVHLNQDYTKAIAVEHFTDKNGLKSFYNVNVTKWKNEIIFTTNTGIYSYNAVKNKFLLHSKLNNILDPTKNTRKLITYGSKTWFVSDDEAGYFFTNTKDKLIHKDLFLNLKGYFNRGMECIVPISENQIVFGSNLGLFFYNLKNNLTTTTVPTLLTSIHYNVNQKQLAAALDNSKTKEFPNKTDGLRFEYAAPEMTKGTQIQFSHKLEPIDKSWSAWQNTSSKEYTHLSPGTYTFMVKSRNLSGINGKETTYHFTILPKWYQTNFAFILYILFSVLFIYFISFRIRKKIEKERIKAQLEAEKTKKLLELELEQLKLIRDKEKINAVKIHLEEDVIEKSKQLANYTLLLSQKKELFSDLQNDLKNLREINKNDETRKKITQIFQKLHQNKIGEEYMEIFDVNFEKVNHNFFEKLKEINPTLTKRELRLCAFVKMDLSNKEIAPLLNISIRGVENARYRARKKLNVQHEENFVSYLISLINE